MKICKFFIVFLCLLFSCGMVYGQNIKINVVSGAERLAYAFVYINGEVMGATDTLGILLLPSSKLRRGDTLSASFVGFESTGILYDGDASQEVNLELKAYYELEPIIVTGRRINMLKLLKKHTDFPRYIYPLNKEYNLSFESEITDGRIKRHSCGEIKLVLSPRLDLDSRFKCLSLDARGDTTELIKRMGSTMIGAMQLSQSLSLIDTYKNAVITSRGTISDERIFILSYTFELGSLQILLHVDKDKKNIRSLETSFLPSDLTDRQDMNVILNPYGKNKTIMLIGYEYDVSVVSTGRSEKIKVDKITESPHRNTWDMFYDKAGNQK